MTEKQDPGHPVESPGGRSDQGPMRTVVSWVVTVFLAALIVAVSLYGASRKAEEPPEPPVRLANVEVQTVQPRIYRETLTLPAMLRADRDASIGSEVAGRIERWAVGEGEWVDRGDVVVVLDTVVLRARESELSARRHSAELNVSRSEAGVRSARLGLQNAHQEVTVRELSVEAAQSDLTLAQIEFDRVQMLVDKGVVDRARLDTARNILTQARLAVSRAREGLEAASLLVATANAGVDEAEAARDQTQGGVAELDAALESVRVQTGKMTLRAPISGTLEEHLTEVGEVVAVGQELARLYDLRFLRATIDVPDRFVPFLNPGNPAISAFIQGDRPGAVHEMSARVEVPGLPKLTGGRYAGLALAARIDWVAQATDPESNTFAVELRFENPAGALRQGVIGQGNIEYLTYPGALVIPVRAVQATDEGPRVLVVESRGDAQLAEVRSIVPGSIREDEVLVLDGLAPGDRLIVAGWKGLVSGQAVHVVLEDGNFRSPNGRTDP